MTRNLKTLTMLASTVLLSATLTGCGEDAKPEPAAKTAQAQTQDLLETIKSRGSITIAMEGTWSPWTYHDKDGKLTGFDVAIGERIAQKIGVKAQFVEGKWDGLLAGLDAGRYDLMINGVGITKAHPDAKIKIALYTPQAGEIGIPLKKSPQTESFRKVVNDTIAELRTSGELGKISVQFFGIDITKQP